MLHNSLLQAERRRLLDRIAEIRATGPVAPAYHFLSQTTTTSKTGRTYDYARLLKQKRSQDKQQVKSLGRVGSHQHYYWQRAIARRDAIAELEMQLSLLADLMERQRANSHVFDWDFDEPKEEWI